jgi:hypothetical protein
MDHEPGRFVNHYQHVVFINNVERDILRREDIRGRRDKLYFDLISIAELVGRLRDLAVNKHVFILNQPLQACAAPALDL